MACDRQAKFLWFKAPRLLHGRTAVSSLQSWEKVCDALHVIIRHHPLPLRTAALLVGLGVSHSADTREGEEGLQAAVGAQHDVCVEAVAHHQAAAGVHAKLGGHTVEHVVVGFAHSLGLALGGCLDGLQQAACTWEEGTTFYFISLQIMNIFVHLPL